MIGGRCTRRGPRVEIPIWNRVTGQRSCTRNSKGGSCFDDRKLWIQSSEWASRFDWRRCRLEYNMLYNQDGGLNVDPGTANYTVPGVHTQCRFGTFRNILFLLSRDNTDTATSFERKSSKTNRSDVWSRLYDTLLKHEPY